jgi:tetratricopeptide (TPR) repeat protein
LFLEGAVALRAGVYLGVAASQKQQNAERIEALAKAAEVDPSNAETAYELGEAFRQLSFQGDDDYEEQARQAIAWFERSRDANPLDAYARVRIGMCLDWLGEHDAALPYYEEALGLDPLNHHLCILRGWHYMQARDYLMASRWFRRSLQIRHWPNPIARKYFLRAEQALKLQQEEQAKPAVGN